MSEVNPIKVEMSVKSNPKLNVSVGNAYVVHDGGNIHYDTTANWNSQTELVGERGHLYVYSDHQQDADNNDIVGFKVGDGTSLLIEMPFSDDLYAQHIIDTDMHVTTAEKDKLSSLPEAAEEDGTYVISQDDGNMSLVHAPESVEIDDTTTSQSKVWSSDKTNSAKMNKLNATGTGTFSLNRKANTTVGGYSFAEGYNAEASGSYSHAEGNGSRASGNGAHAEGGYTDAIGNYSHAEGYASAIGQYSHAEGKGYASCDYSHAEGYCPSNQYGAKSYAGHAEGYYTKTLGYSNDSNYNLGNHAEGYYTTAGTSNSITKSRHGAHAEGCYTLAEGTGSHAEGYGYNSTYTIKASGFGSHAEGRASSSKSVTADGDGSHAEGYTTTASGNYSHAEGYDTTSRARGSHSEGDGALASNTAAHAEGGYSTASGSYSHAEGYYTTANHKSQHVFGEYNVLDDSTAVSDARGNYVEIVGNGTGSNALSNARTLDWNGNEVLAGTIDATDFGTTLNGKIDTKVSTAISEITTEFTGTLTAGATSLTIAHSQLTGNETFDFFTSIYGVSPLTFVVNANDFVLTFESQSVDMGVKIRMW